MEIAGLKKLIQQHFTDGLLLIIGSGLSSAEGLPGMAALGTFLQLDVPSRLDATMGPAWTSIANDLASGVDVETALQRTAIPPALEDLIISSTARFVEKAEASAIAEVVSGARQLRISKLLPFVPLGTTRSVPIVTSNYDRLIEIGAEIAGLAVDTMFLGQYVGHVDEERARRGFVDSVAKGSGKHGVKLIYRPRVRLYKPHGSLDWYRGLGGPLWCQRSLDLPRLVITPGSTKYRRGYDIPFDRHREQANVEIDRALRILCIGYGFNDDHLQVHLKARIESGVPCISVTHTPSENLKNLFSSAPMALSLSYGEEAGVSGTVLRRGSTTVFYPSSSMWDLQNLVTEALAP